MRIPLFTALMRYLRNGQRWYEQTPERALDQAYDAALMIQAMENEHFDGQSISNSSGKYSESTYSYFDLELKKCLKIARIRLSEFRTSRIIFDTTDSSADARSGAYTLANRDRGSIILEKLKFIDQVLDRYKPAKPSSTALVPTTPYDHLNSIAGVDLTVNGQKVNPLYLVDSEADETSGIMDKTGILPRSFAGTLNKIKRDLDPNSEERVVQDFNNHRVKTRIAMRFLLLLIIIPLLTQQLSKTFIIGPITDWFRDPDDAKVFINFELREEALHEFQLYKEQLEFSSLLGLSEKVSETPAESLVAPKASGKSEPKKLQAIPSEADEKKAGEPGKESPKESKNEPLTREAQLEAQLKEKAEEIAASYKKQGSNAIKNVFADLFGLAAFAVVVATNRPAIAVLKSFIDETIYGLSDSAKAFVIILFTDMFVGFHSPHGWEVLLEGISRHIGVPANREFIFLFIATFPVILDTIFKYWIFRYLNRASPSAVATYRSMNE
jgi:hypothetical protein